MTETLIEIDRAGKKFCRSMSSAALNGVKAGVRRLLRLQPRTGLRPDEFWAIQNISLSVARGECLGVIGPNGAGKSTLLKLINRSYRPDSGTVATFAPVKSLIQLGSGLQPMLTGRENIYSQCALIGLNKRETDGLMDDIIAFAELASAIDAPVKTYSDGMYARLEFSIATCVPMDILLIDEVLAVGDIAFQLRSLERLNQLKRHGTAVVFVSHSEMNVRQVADRCLLLFGGKQVALGATDAIFAKYYESIGYLNKQLRPLGVLMQPPSDLVGLVSITALLATADHEASKSFHPGCRVMLDLRYDAQVSLDSVYLSLQFWNTAQILVATIDSSALRVAVRLTSGLGRLRVEIPFLVLTPGLYRVAAGFSVDGKWVSYAGHLCELHVVGDELGSYDGLAIMSAKFELSRDR